MDTLTLTTRLEAKNMSNGATHDAEYYDIYAKYYDEHTRVLAVTDDKYRYFEDWLVKITDLYKTNRIHPNYLHAAMHALYDAYDETRVSSPNGRMRRDVIAS